MWGFDVHPILSNPLKYFSLKILYHEALFTSRVFEGIISYPGISPIGCLLVRVLRG
jgi:hypothetical protein